jgi:2-methylisocitrate lyase-like PEP mutase family enzyme
MAHTDTLRALHRGPELLVLPNAWDVASALRFAALPGCRAVATTSAGVARALGFEDGEKTPRDEMLRAVERIAAAVELPLTADLEAGYGDAPGTAAAALAAGAAGMNLEDSRGGKLLALDEQVEIVRAVRAAAPELVLNARVDVFVRGGDDVDDAVARANAYLAAGADCTYPILAPDEVVEELVTRIDGPVNILARPGQALDRFRQIGVARISFGPYLADAALAQAEQLAAAALGG